MFFSDCGPLGVYIPGLPFAFLTPLRTAIERSNSTSFNQSMNSFFWRSDKFSAMAMATVWVSRQFRLTELMEAISLLLLAMAKLKG